MSAFKGTPGPWEVTESTESEYVMVIGANGAGLFCENEAHPGAREDAHLIAAAPELLEALEIAVRQNSHDMQMTGEELRQCEAAIAKATGGEA